MLYLLVGQSLDRDIIESRVDVKVLDDLETYIQTGRDIYEVCEQYMLDNNEFFRDGVVQTSTI